MVDQIGIKRPVIPFTLVTKEDFVWAWTWQPPPENPSQTTFPVGSELFVLWADNTRWDFTINGAVATIKKESEVADLIEDGAPYWLKFVQATTPPTDEVLCIGNVKRQEPTA